jgi:hypothetical protein
MTRSRLEDDLGEELRVDWLLEGFFFSMPEPAER